jgi:hypothetical protein
MECRAQRHKIRFDVSQAAREVVELALDGGQIVEMGGFRMSQGGFKAVQAIREFI